MSINKSTRIEKVCISEILYNLSTPTEKTSWTILGMTYSTKSSTRCLLEQKILAIIILIFFVTSTSIL